MEKQKYIYALIDSQFSKLNKKDCVLNICR